MPDLIESTSFKLRKKNCSLLILLGGMQKSSPRERPICSISVTLGKLKMRLFHIDIFLRKNSLENTA